MGSNNGSNKKNRKVRIEEPPPQQRRLEDLTINELKPLLKERGLPVSGRKAALIDRLRNGASGGPKPKPWQHSDAKKALKKALLDPTSPIHNMSFEEVLNSDPRYKQYPNFAKYYRDLKKSVEEEKIQVQADDAAARMHLMNFPRSHLNERGYPHWDTHNAKAFLETDVANKLHEKMKPSQLRKTRSAYKEFPPEVFAQRVHREVAKQKAAKFWAHKRNKKGMKKYLKEIAARTHG
jgi:methionine synthase II (cobalamin-independent)